MTVAELKALLDLEDPNRSVYVVSASTHNFVPADRVEIERLYDQQDAASDKFVLVLS